MVMIAAVLASADSLQLASQLQPDPFSVASAQQRFAAVAARLPAFDEIGYISDLPLEGKDGAPAFLVAQYALAPRLLTPASHTGPQLAIGNFSRPSDYAKAGAKTGYVVEADLGSGVVLFTKAK